MIARSDAKHVRSRQNLIKILREPAELLEPIQAIAKRLDTEAGVVVERHGKNRYSIPKLEWTSRTNAAGLLQFIERTAQRWERQPK